MINGDFALWVAANALSILGTGVFLGVMWRVRSEPTALPLFGVAAVLFLGAIVHPVLAMRTTEYWLLGIYSVIVLGGGSWFLFALRYTGRGGRVTPIAVGLVGVLFATMAAIDAASVTPVFERYVSVVNIVLNSIVLLLATLVAIGVILVIADSYNAQQFLLQGSLFLSTGAVVLVFVPIVVSKFQRPILFPAMLALASGLLSVAVSRYRTFETLPVVRVAGRDRVIEELSDAVVVVDRDGRIRDLNPSTETFFDIDRATVLGQPLDDVFPTPFDPAHVASAQEPVHVQTDDDATLAVTATEVTDERNRSFGYLLVCQDVTDRRNREDRLAVLNQLLTGAMREQMGAVADSAAELQRTPTDAEPASSETVGDEIHAATTDLLSLVDRTRELERALANGNSNETDERTDVVAVVRSVSEKTNGDVDPISAFSDESVSVAVGEKLLRTTLETLLTDAASRAKDTTEVTVTETDGVATVQITNENPNARNGQQPTSTVSVQIARLAVERAGGTVSVSTDETGRTHVSIQLPKTASNITASERSSSPDRERSQDTTGGEKP